jgi:hypothetical protein
MIGHSFRVIYGEQTQYPDMRIIQSPNLFCPFSKERTTGWPLVVHLLVAQAKHSVRLTRATPTMRQRPMNFVLVNRKHRNVRNHITQGDYHIPAVRVNHDHFLYRKTVILCKHFCKTEMEQADVHTTLVWLNWFRKNLQIQSRNNITCCQHEERSASKC